MRNCFSTVDLEHSISRSLECELYRIFECLSLDPRRMENVCESFKGHRPAYHNEDHCFSVAITFSELLKDLGFSEENIRNGVVAAIYHDAAHTGTPNDDKNIPLAIDYFKKNFNNFPDFESLDEDLIVGLIESTHNQFSGIREKIYKTLHDSDILQTVKGNKIMNDEWQRRLGSETNSEVTHKTSLHFVLRNLEDRNNTVKVNILNL